MTATGISLSTLQNTHGGNDKYIQNFSRQITEEEATKVYPKVSGLSR